MITEDYVSFETAKLLKEKGFDVSEIDAYFPFVYYANGKMDFYDDDNSLFVCEAVTLQMAMKWLREVHKLYIVVGPYVHEDGIFNVFYIKNVKDKNMVVNIRTKTGFNSYEEACEAAIKYCLENLI